MRLLLHTDGGSRGNPGPSAAAFVVWDADTGEPNEWGGTHLGDATNNNAEYNALILGLRFVIYERPGVTELIVRMDSQLVVRQMQGAYRVGDELAALHAMAKWAVDHLQGRGCTVTFEHVPREQNADADRLCNEILDAGPGTASANLH